MGLWAPRADLNFLSLQRAVFCIECELIHENNTPTCHACGSQAVLSLSRVMGGSLLHEPRATLLQDSAMDDLVRDLLSTVPVAAEMVRDRGLVAARSAVDGELTADLLAAGPAQLHLEPAISVIAGRAAAMTGATGSAIGLRWGKDVVCSARAGRTAPDLGMRLQTTAGLSGECVRIGQILRCDDSEEDPIVDRDSCRRLGVRSILVAPLQHFRKSLGIFEVLSSEAYAFDDLAVANLQMLAGFMVAAIAQAVGFGGASSPAKVLS